MNRIGHSRLLRGLSTIALAGAACLASCSRGTDLSFPRAPVVLISIDTLRADHLPAYGYKDVETPAIDGLRRDGILFENAYSHYPLTLPSHTTLLSGQLPTNDGVRDNIGYRFDAKSHPALAVALSSRGYATGGFVSSYVLRAATGLATGFGAYDSDIELERGASLDLAQRPGSVTLERALAWLDGHAAEPFFLFVHFYEPHAPYEPPEPFRSRYAERPYDGEIATADGLVGRLLDDLKRRGLYDRSIVLLVSDHGEGLGDHDEKFHGMFLYRSTLHVPLLLKLPGGRRAGESIARPVGLVDVLPTVTRLVGIDPPAALDGIPLLEEPATEDRRLYAETFYTRLHFGWSELVALTDARWRFVQAPQPELFDVVADPGESVNLVERERRVFAERREQVSHLVKPLAPPALEDAETAAKLASLGYLSGARATDGALPDPKSQRDAVKLIESGLEAFGAKNWNDAAVAFESLVAANPRMTDMWGFLARALHQLGREPEALAAWQKALVLSSGDPITALAVANSFLDLKRFREARDHAALAANAAPDSYHELMIRIDLTEGMEKEAEAEMDRAVADGHATEAVRRQLALRRLREGEPARAVELLQPVAAKGEVPTLTLLGLALSDIGRSEEGLPILERAIAKEPDFPKANEALGTVLLRLGRDADARARLEHAVSLDAKLPDAWNSLGVARYRGGDTPGALDAWTRATALDAEQFDALFNLGLTAAATGDVARARRALDRFVRTAPADRFAEELGKARAVLGEIDARAGGRKTP